MIKAERFKGLEEKIGYSFTNKRLLALAMTHSSYANEQRGRRKANNERLEFLGDAVLEVTISDYVFREYPSYNEGRLTKLRSSLVCEYTLAICARDVELGKYILLSRGEDATGGRERDSILSDAFEALIGAIYIDGGMDKARFFIHNHLLKDVEDKFAILRCENDFAGNGTGGTGFSLTVCAYKRSRARSCQGVYC